MNDRPLETGWLADTPTEDTVLRAFLHNQARIGEILAADRGRVERDGSVAMIDSGGPGAFMNMSVLFRPLVGLDDEVLDGLDRFVPGFGQRAATLLSIWPTPDLSARGWTLVGHPACVLRSPAPVEHHAPEDVVVERALDTGSIAVAERVFVDGYPIEEAADAPPGSVLPAALADTDLSIRIGVLDGDPVAVGLGHVAFGVVNLCGGATLAAARRRGVWASLVWARVADAPDLPSVAFTSDDSRPGFVRMGFAPVTRFTLWTRSGTPD